MEMKMRSEMAEITAIDSTSEWSIASRAAAPLRTVLVLVNSILTARRLDSRLKTSIRTILIQNILDDILEIV